MKALDSRGFTLLELLLVLMIVMVVSSCALYINNRYIEKQTFEIFYNQLLLDARVIQLSAMEEGRNMKLIFSSNGTVYVGRKSLLEPILEKQLPSGYRLSKSSNLSELAFQPNGNIEKFGTLTFETPSGLRMVRVYIGKGKMAVD